MLCVLIPLVTLTACETVHSDTSKATQLILPPVIQYSRSFQNKAADEALANTCPAHISLGKDYKLTRDRIRVANQELEKI